MSEYINLRNKVLDAAHAYYIDAKPVMSDQEYDILFRKLQELEKVECAKDPITAKVRCGIQVKNSFKRVAHTPPMLSLDNAFTEEEFKNWCPKDNNLELVKTHKLDGASLSLVYSDGILEYGLRRGDGKLGDDITGSVAYIKGVPSTIPSRKHEIVVRGEVMCPAFAADFAQDYKNQRNFVSGSLNLKDPKMVAKRKLCFVAYSLIGLDFDLYTDMMDTLAEMGFMTVAHLGMVLTSVGDCDFEHMATNMPTVWPTDGIVVSLNDMHLIKKLGNTSHHPRGAIAVKPQAQVKETTILHVEFQVGKTGNITPVAILDPIQLDDTTVSRCTLHNFQEIKALDVAINDTVKVMKSGFIIPKIIDVVHRPTNRIPIKISMCVSCGSKLVQDGAYLKCVNEDCGDMTVQRLLKFTKTARIMGFGKATIEKLVDWGITEISELLNCDYDFFENVLDSEKIAEKLAIQILERPKELSYVETLAALNIPMVNQATAEKLLAAGFDNIFKMQYADQLMEVPGIGPKKADKIAEYIRDNREELQRLDSLLPLKVTALDTITNTDDFITIAITGKVKASRTKAKETLKNKGFILAGSVTKKTQILLVGSKPGQDKITKAEKLGISIVQYAGSEFETFI